MGEIADNTADAAASAEIPPRISDHELLHVIAAGGYGQVWLARNAVGTSRAVKIVRRDRFECGEDFEREFRGLQSFEPISRSHDGLVDILQIGRHDDEGWFYYVMELADDAGERAFSRAVELNEVGRDVPIAPRQAGDSTPYQPRTRRAELKSRGALPA